MTDKTTIHYSLVRTIFQDGQQTMTKIVHPVAGTVAILTIATFWFSTVLTELFGSREVVTAVKTAIPWGFLLLIPAF